MTASDTRRDDLLRGAVHILVAVKEVEPAVRLDAFALAIDAWVKTYGTLEVGRG